MRLNLLLHQRLHASATARYVFPCGHADAKNNITLLDRLNLLRCVADFGATCFLPAGLKRDLSKYRAN